MAVKLKSFKIHVYKQNKQFYTETSFLNIKNQQLCYEK